MDEKDRKQRQDFADHQSEVAGIDNGRADRFLTGTASRRTRVTSQREAAERAFQTQLQLLLNDPAYALAHARATAVADDAQDKINAAMDDVTTRITHLKDTLDDMEDRTAKLPDGTCVFRDREGRLIAADGRHLSDAEAASLLNPDALLSYEYYKSLRDALTSATKRQDKLSGAQDRLDDARRRLNDPDEPPPSVEEVEDIEDDIRRVIKTVEQLDHAQPVFNAAASQSLEDGSFELNIGSVTSAPG